MGNNNTSNENKMTFRVEGYINKNLKMYYDEYIAKGMWGCGQCASNFTIPNEDGAKPWCCPFCGSHNIMEDKEPENKEKVNEETKEKADGTTTARVTGYIIGLGGKLNGKDR